ncbi:MAG: TIGR04086 family membrane protein [Oscillospiraceae bacterium]
MDKSRKNMSKMHSSVKSTLISVLVGELITIVCLFIFSILMAKVDIPLAMTDIFVILAASLGGLIAGYCNGRMMKEKGLLYGAFSGGILVLILIIFNVIFNGFTSTGLTFVKLALVMIFAIVGSIIGVNKKSKRIKY